MKIQKSAQDYLEAILIISKRSGSVRSVDIANELGYSKPSVSVAMKNLRAEGYVDFDGDGAVILTDKGRAVAEDMYERHTVITDWLISIGVTPDQAREDACNMEHVISAQTFEAIKRTIAEGK